MLKHIKYLYYTMISVYILLILYACSTPQGSTIDELGCPKPPPEVFTKVGLDASVGSSTFGKVVTGNVGLKITPDVVDLMSKEARNEAMISWLVCREEKNGLIKTPEQNAYAHNVARFYTTDPTPEQAIEWHKNNPYPSGATIIIKGKAVGKNGEPLIGASVSIIGTSLGATTDIEGNYKITLPISLHDTELEIQISYTGYAQQTETVHILAPYVEIPPIKIEEP